MGEAAYGPYILWDVQATPPAAEGNPDLGIEGEVPWAACLFFLPCC